MKTSGPGHDDSPSIIWETYATRIGQLYVDEGKKLEEVKHIMEMDGFPMFSLSTWAAKMKTLELSKNLKSKDWPAIYQHIRHRLQKPGEKRLKKPTVILKHGKVIPWKKAWKEMRRSGAMNKAPGLSDSNRLLQLPHGIVIRTPSPEISPAFPQPELLQTLHDAQDSSPLGGLRHPSGADRTDYLAANPQISTNNNLVLNNQSSVWKLDAQPIPWVGMQRMLRTHPNDDSNSTRREPFPGDMLPIDSLGFLPPPYPSRDLSYKIGSLGDDQEQIRYMGNAVYVLSNCLHDSNDKGRGLELFHERLAWAPNHCLDLLRNCSPSIRAAWEALIQDTQDNNRRDSFDRLLDVGIEYSWVNALLAGHDFLFHAVRMKCVNKVHRLLQFGCNINMGWYSNPYSAVVEAFNIGDLHCAELLLKDSNINNRIIIPTNTSEGTQLRRKWSTNFLESIFHLDEHNPVHMDGLDLLLRHNPNVDESLGWEHNTALKDTRILVKLSEFQSPTTLDHLIYFKRAFFAKLFVRTQVPSSRITRVGILLALERGQQALHEYIDKRMNVDPLSNRHFVMGMLETVLVEQFLVPESRSIVASSHWVDTQINLGIVKDLLASGASLTLPTIGLDAGILLDAVLRQLKRRHTDDGLKLLDLLFRHGAVIRAQSIKQAVPQEGTGMLEYLQPLVPKFSEHAVTSLAEACSLHNFEAMEFLLTAGVDPNSFIPVNGMQMSILAVATLDWERSRDSRPGLYCKMIRILVDNGANLVVGPHDLHPSRLIQQMLRYTTSGIFMKTHYLVENMRQTSFSDLPAYLLEACFNLERDIGFEERFDRIKTFEFLYDQGAEVRPGSPLAVLIVGGGREGSIEGLVTKLISAGADLNAYSSYTPEFEPGPSYSPLQAACITGNEDLVIQLLEKGADLNLPARGERGKTALQALCSWMAISLEEHKRKVSLAEILLDHGAEVNAPPAMTEGFTALQYAAISGDIEIALLLLQHGADINAPPCKHDGQTALDAAARRGRLDMVKFLLNYNAFSGRSGTTGYDGAIEEAENKHHFAVADLIREHARHRELMVVSPRVLSAPQHSNGPRHEAPDTATATRDEEWGMAHVTT